MEEEAPKTTAAVWSNMPHTGEAIHAILSGQMLTTVCKFKVTELENPKVLGILRGDLTFATQPWVGSSELSVMYGNVNLSQTWLGWAPLNHFGRIEEGLDELFEVGRRIHRNGVENVTIRRM
jgi:hypothetical protein